MPGVLALTLFASVILGGDSRLGSGFKSHGSPCTFNPGPIYSPWRTSQIFGKQWLEGWSEVRWTRFSRGGFVEMLLGGPQYWSALRQDNWAPTGIYHDK